MNLSVPQKIRLPLTVIVVAVILLWSIGSGYNNGRLYAQSRVVDKNALTLKQGLEYFFQDQDRYPTPLEFQNEQLMLKYFFPFPPVEFKSAQCPQSYVYKRLSLREYQLNFCLLKNVGEFKAGWQKFEAQAPI